LNERKQRDGCENYFGVRHKIDFDQSSRALFNCEKKSRRAVASERDPQQISHMNLNWEQLCEIASAEIEATLAALPKPLGEKAAKLPVTFEPHPNDELVAEGIAPDTLGLFTGAEFVEEEAVPMPPQITLFLENIEDFAEGDKKMYRDEVRTTFLHELGHYFGLDEDELVERGLE
jgi:predicted Zn-dependent protease with MMP-like domain